MAAPAPGPGSRMAPGRLRVDQPAARLVGAPAREPGGRMAAPGASQPLWPGTTVLATIAMGAADGEIQKAGADLQAAADKQDLKAMWGAADGLATMIDGLMPNIDRLEIYEPTGPWRRSTERPSRSSRRARSSSATRSRVVTPPAWSPAAGRSPRA